VKSPFILAIDPNLPPERPEFIKYAKAAKPPLTYTTLGRVEFSI